MLSRLSVALIALLGASEVAAVHKKCKNTALSCTLKNESITDTCCYESPGGLVLATQFWTYNPAVGPADSWTIHGLWPDFCDGTYPEFCNPDREYFNMTEIILNANRTGLYDYMTEYWGGLASDNEGFWEHEWNKHGTCMSTLEPACYRNYKPQQEVIQYFAQTVRLFKKLPSYTWLADAGIVPTTEKNYTLTAVRNALVKQTGGFLPTIACDKSGALTEIWYYYHVKGPITFGEYVPTNTTYPGSCPESLRYLPKRTPFVGKGALDVYVLKGNKNGCVAADGTWSATDCATFTASKTDGGFILASPSGNCSVDTSTLALACGGSKFTVFSASDANLAINDGSGFSADAVPTADAAQTLTYYAGKVNIEATWRGLD